MAGHGRASHCRDSAVPHAAHLSTELSTSPPPSPRTCSRLLQAAAILVLGEELALGKVGPHWAPVKRSSLLRALRLPLCS